MIVIRKENFVDKNQFPERKKIILMSTPDTREGRFSFCEYYKKFIETSYPNTETSYKLYPFQEEFLNLIEHSVWNNKPILFKVGRTSGKSVMRKIYLEYYLYQKQYIWNKKFRKIRNKFRGKYKHADRK